MDGILKSAASLRQLAATPARVLRDCLRRTPVPPPGLPLLVPAEPVAILRAADRGFSRFVGADDVYVDLDSSSVRPVLSALRSACEAVGQTLRLLIGKRVLPASDTHIARAARESVFSVLICGPNEHVREHRTLIVWKDRGEFWFCASDRLPIALFPKQAPSLDGNVGQIDTAVRFPVDAVYTWVNSEDPGWRALLAPFRELTPLDRDRFGQSDELRYSMRSLALFAPWIRRIYIVSNCARPDWLLETARVAWVDHSEIIPGILSPRSIRMRSRPSFTGSKGCPSSSCI